MPRDKAKPVALEMSIFCPFSFFPNVSNFFFFVGGVSILDFLFFSLLVTKIYYVWLPSIKIWYKVLSISRYKKNEKNLNDLLLHTHRLAKLKQQNWSHKVLMRTTGTHTVGRSGV